MGLKFLARNKPQPGQSIGFNDLKPPKNVSGVKQILGMFNVCYRKFIPVFAKLAEPIVELIRGKIKKKSEIKWDQTLENACHT